MSGEDRVSDERGIADADSARVIYIFAGLSSLMLYCQHFPDWVRDVAREQAELYGGDYEPKYKGNLGELTFYSYCDEKIPDDDWSWDNEDAVANRQLEWNSSDFEVYGLKIDVKAKSDIADFRLQTIWHSCDEDKSNETDAIVGIWLNPDLSCGTILGWIPYDDIVDCEMSFSEKLVIKSPKKQDTGLTPIPFQDIQNLGTL